MCNSERVDREGRRLTINGHEVEKATISMMFRLPEVRERVGFMRAMRVGEDAEYYERVKAVFGSEIVLHATLLSQRFAPGSLLFSDGQTTTDGGEVRHRRSAEAERVWRAALETIAEIRAGRADPYVGYEDEQ